MESKDPRKDFLSIQQRNAVFSKFGRKGDCIFLVGTEPDQKVIRAHRVTLAIVSPVFKAMFVGGMAERKYPIPIPDIEPKTFMNMLRYIYGIKISKYDITFSSIEDACNVYYAATKYILPRLKSKCTGYIYSRLCRYNKYMTKYICLIYEFASLYEEERIKVKCEQIIRKQTREIINDSSFNEAQLSTLVTIFSLEEISCTELDLFNALDRYVKAQCEDKADPTECADKADPTECEEKADPTECEDMVDPTECEDMADLTECEDKADPTECADKADPTKCEDKADPTECKNKADPTECADKADSTECEDKADPTECEDKGDPTECEDKADPTECADKADATECADKADPTESENKEDPTECENKADPTECENKVDPTECGDKADPTECEDKADPTECGDKADPTVCDNKADITECEEKADPTECEDKAYPAECSTLRNIGQVNEWSDAETEPERQHGDPSTECKDRLNIRSALEQIRFLTLTAEQFAEGPAKSGLLTEAEVSAILVNITSDESNVPMPSGFSTCKKSRWDLFDKMIFELCSIDFPGQYDYGCDKRRFINRRRRLSDSDDDDYYVSSDEF